MKTCRKCNTEKPLDQFHVRKKGSKDGRQSQCRQCLVEYNRRSREEWRANGQLINQYLEKYHKNKPCIDCGVQYPPCVLDFDHRPEEEKGFNIGTHGSEKATAYHIEKIEKEIAKCDLVCANCHRVRTRDRHEAK